MLPGAFALPASGSACSCVLSLSLSLSLGSFHLSPSLLSPQLSNSLSFFISLPLPLHLSISLSACLSPSLLVDSLSVPLSTMARDQTLTHPSCPFLTLGWKPRGKEAVQKYREFYVDYFYILFSLLSTKGRVSKQSHCVILHRLNLEPSVRAPVAASTLH